MSVYLNDLIEQVVLIGLKVQAAYSVLDINGLDFLAGVKVGFQVQDL